MPKSVFRKFVSAALMACSAAAFADEPLVLGAGALDSVSAASASHAVAWAYTSATSSPYFQIVSALSLGASSMLSRDVMLVASIGIGVGSDAPQYSIGLSLPVTFR